MSTLETQLNALIKKQRREVERVFVAAIRDVVDRVTLNRVTMALRRGDINAAIDALGMSRAALSPVVQSLTGTYAEAGALVSAETVFKLPDLGRTVFRFDLANPRASDFLAKYSSNLVTAMAEDTRGAIRTVIQAGYDAGRNPLDVARDLAGRIGPNGRRTGGIIGLNEPQARYVQNMRARLASGDPVEMRKVLNMTRRDKRLDGVIKRAIESGKPVSAKDINRLTGRYSDRLLQLRGETIARTEVGHAVEAARMDSFAMGADEAGIPDHAIERTWFHGGGRNDPREGHRDYSGTKVIGRNTPFTMPDGTRLMYPRDTSLGAGADHVANCTCRQQINVLYELL